MRIETTRRPIIVIGAARSGTKILRRVLATHPSIIEIPHDINFIWKYGNYHVDHDALTPSQARTPVRRYIRQHFASYGRTGMRIVEKTVSNCLRIGFVRRVFPDCVFINLVRDGRDVAESAARMWQAPLELGRVLGKARDLPLAAVPSYAASYVASYARRALSRTRRLPSWGPRFVGIDTVARDRSILEVCAVQWLRCIEASEAGLADIPEKDVVQVRYEELVERPDDVFERVMAALRFESTADMRREVSSLVTSGAVGKYRQVLSLDEIGALNRELGPTLERLGYA